MLCVKNTNFKYMICVSYNLQKCLTHLRCLILVSICICSSLQDAKHQQTCVQQNNLNRKMEEGRRMNIKWSKPWRQRIQHMHLDFHLIFFNATSNFSAIEVNYCFFRKTNIYRLFCANYYQIQISNLILKPYYQWNTTFKAKLSSNVNMLMINSTSIKLRNPISKHHEFNKNLSRKAISFCLYITIKLTHQLKKINLWVAITCSNVYHQFFDAS